MKYAKSVQALLLISSLTFLILTEKEEGNTTV